MLNNIDSNACVNTVFAILTGKVDDNMFTENT